MPTLHLPLLVPYAAYRQCRGGRGTPYGTKRGRVGTFITLDLAYPIFILKDNHPYSDL